MKSTEVMQFLTGDSGESSQTIRPQTSNAAIALVGGPGAEAIGNQGTNM